MGEDGGHGDNMTGLDVTASVFGDELEQEDDVLELELEESESSSDDSLSGAGLLSERWYGMLQ